MTGSELNQHQLEAIEKIKNGSVLCGGVGSGKSRTALAYYLLKECQGEIKIPGSPYKTFHPMKKPRDLYIITTAKKRDSEEWEEECLRFCLASDPDTLCNGYGVKVTVDSWNCIKKYQKVAGAFFIFDEQRVVGSGSWVKSFLKIARQNHWILLSATPGDTWSDYIPVFVANGLFRNRTEFNQNHCVFSPFTNFPKIDHYIGETLLERYRDSILIPLKDNRKTVRHHHYVKVGYDRAWYRKVMKDRWDPWENCPIEETGKLIYLLRKVANSDAERITQLDKILKEKKYLIVFYNFDYELTGIKAYLSEIQYPYKEWNGHKHEQVPKNKKGWVYLVQYSAGCEGWNCVTTDTIVFYSQNYSYRTTEQARGRIDRMNTPFVDLHYYYFWSSAPIDMAIYMALQNKRNFNERSFLLKNGG